MSKYITQTQLWRSFGESALTKVRGETAGTGSGSFTTFTLSQDNLISGSETVYSGGTAVSNTTYSMNLEDGKISLTAGSSVVYTIDYDYGTLSPTHVQSIIDQAEEELEAITGRNFDLTTTSEYVDVDGARQVFFLKQYPVQNIISLSTNTAALADSPTWEVRTSGLGNDFIQEDNQLTFIDNFPDSGKQRLKINYVYGYSSSDIPDMVKDLNILLAQRKMVNSGIYRSVVKGDVSEEAKLDYLNERIDYLKTCLHKQDIEAI